MAREKKVTTKVTTRLSPQEGPQFDFLKDDSDIVIFGGGAGGGKSYGLLLAPLRYIGVGGFNCTIFRKTAPQIRNPGALWDISTEIYTQLKAAAVESRLLWRFENSGESELGAEVRFAHLEYDSDRFNFDGSQICWLCFDELQQFSSIQFFYLLSRNRSTCGIKPKVLCTCNPDSESWLRHFIDWWIGEDGFPIADRAGQKRYFIRVDGEIKWGGSKNELLKENEEFKNEYDRIISEYNVEKAAAVSENEKKSLKSRYTERIYRLKNAASESIKSVTFIPSSVYDNKVLLRTNPTYLSNLKSLPLVERERLLNGNWNIRPESGKFFNREWFECVKANEIPQSGEEVRYWDFAATKPNANNRDPDYTVGIKMRKKDNKYFIIDVIRVRENPAEIEKIFLNTSLADRMAAENLGIRYKVRWEEEGGSSGKSETYRLKSLLAGYDCRGVRSTGDKETRARALAIQAEIGNVKLKIANWNSDLLNEMHLFGDKYLKHDDQVDGCSGAFNELTSIYIHPTIPEEEIIEINPEERERLRIEGYRALEEAFLNGD